ncbi:hypothetical protein ROJ8625_02478 [Roseivivax jejudonensis]|uniref:PepSY domain-containing protein n=1 Tax=Roseivivax jejudonensis TaxID=1529041 RepID=A0A1X6ZFH9_9RHOB|nr:hypothetical protein [Roseivivax jejudonensis]SLN50195.1 hypothetical protein ROJ8625_02478 [Roseivivax jejudonensis]
MKRRVFLAGAAALVVAPACAAEAQGLAESVAEQLRAQGFGNIRVSRTWLGRIRIVADGPAGQREIVIDPSTGSVLRDYTDRRRGDDDDDDRDDDDDDDRDDDDDDDDDGGGGDGEED